jgi:hypothetical protein
MLLVSSIAEDALLLAIGGTVGILARSVRESVGELKPPARLLVSGMMYFKSLLLSIRCKLPKHVYVQGLVVTVASESESSSNAVNACKPTFCSL